MPKASAGAATTSRRTCCTMWAVRLRSAWASSGENTATAMVASAAASQINWARLRRRRSPVPSATALRMEDDHIELFEKDEGQIESTDDDAQVAEEPARAALSV